MDRARPKWVSGETITLGRAALIASIVLSIALVHVFRAGTYLPDLLFRLYYSYFSDIVVPFGMYFLLCLNDVTFLFLRDWRVKAALVFGVASFTEVMQAFGVPILGQTFDPLDFTMFGIGVLLAAFVDRSLFGRHLRWWTPKTAGAGDAIR